MKLNENFVTHNSGSETIIVPTADAGFSGVVKGNKSVGCILECLKEDTTEEAIIKRLHEKFIDDSGEIERDVKKVIGDLRRIGAIDE